MDKVSKIRLVEEQIRKADMREVRQTKELAATKELLVFLRSELEDIHGVSKLSSKG